jgi:hypothetical protein
MYDANTLRQQIETAWANFIVGESLSRQERANRYKTKKIIMQAHGHQAYFQIEFALEHQALSYELGRLADTRPFELIASAPLMIGVLGAMAEVMGQVQKIEEEPEPEAEPMAEDLFFAQHFSSSLSDAVSGIRKKKPLF